MKVSVVFTRFLFIISIFSKGVSLTQQRLTNQDRNIELSRKKYNHINENEQIQNSFTLESTFELGNKFLKRAFRPEIDIQNRYRHDFREPPELLEHTKIRKLSPSVLELALIAEAVYRKANTPSYRISDIREGNGTRIALYEPKIFHFNPFAPKTLIFSIRGSQNIKNWIWNIFFLLSSFYIAPKYHLFLKILLSLKSLFIADLCISSVCNFFVSTYKYSKVYILSTIVLSLLLINIIYCSLKKIWEFKPCQKQLLPSLEELEEYIYEMVEKKSNHQPVRVIIVGHSLGGILAQLLASMKNLKKIENIDRFAVTFNAAGIHRKFWSHILKNHQFTANPIYNIVSHKHEVVSQLFYEHHIGETFDLNKRPKHSMCYLIEELRKMDLQEDFFLSSYLNLRNTFEKFK